MYSFVMGIPWKYSQFCNILKVQICFNRINILRNNLSVPSMFVCDFVRDKFQVNAKGSTQLNRKA